MAMMRYLNITTDPVAPKVQPISYLFVCYHEIRETVQLQSENRVQAKCK